MSGAVEGMDMVRRTKHAEIRARQRGIPRVVLDWLIHYGTPHHDHRCGMEYWSAGVLVVFYFDSRSRAALRNIVDRQTFARHSGHLNCYAVVGANGDIITAGHRTQKFRRDS